MQGIAIRLAPFANGRAHFHRIGGNAVLNNVQPGNMRGSGNGCIGRVFVANFPQEDIVGRMLGPNRRCTGRNSGCDACNGGKLGEVHFYGVSSGAGLLAGFGHDKGNAIAHKAHPVFGKQQARGFQRSGKRHDAGNFTIGRKVIRGVNCKHARHRLCGRRVHRSDFRMAIGAAQGRAKGRAGKLDIIGVNAGASQQPRIFYPLHGFSHARLA